MAILTIKHEVETKTQSDKDSIVISFPLEKGEGGAKEAKLYMDFKNIIECKEKIQNSQEIRQYINSLIDTIKSNKS